jgi:hypothetical protein
MRPTDVYHASSILMSIHRTSQGRRSAVANRTLSLALGAALCLVVAGCGASDYPLAPVAGSVTLDGEPLSGAVVNFQPIAAGDAPLGPGSVGRTDAAGSYRLATVAGEPGAWVGSHKVRIYSFSPESPAEADSDREPSQERVPERYNYRTGLVFEVPASGTDKADFQLTTDPR